MAESTKINVATSTEDDSTWSTNCSELISQWNALILPASYKGLFFSSSIALGDKSHARMCRTSPNASELDALAVRPCGRLPDANLGPSGKDGTLLAAFAGLGMILLVLLLYIKNKGWWWGTVGGVTLTCCDDACPPIATRAVPNPLVAHEAREANHSSRNKLGKRVHLV
ncbi:hypothetical protein HUJ05_007197 [Dendroctonus ponderosae]|nr:hypothetical protein HUJ05_007197 [Dendroctonus ponderosae]